MAEGGLPLQTMIWVRSEVHVHASGIEFGPVSSGPAVRASAVRDTLAFLDKFDPGAQSEVLARVPLASREAILSAPRTSWISIEDDHYTIDAIIGVFGRERAIRFWRDSLADLVERPLLGNFVSGMVRVFGRDPTRVVALFPRGWSLVFRDMCTPRLVSGAGGQPVIRFEHIAPEVGKYPNYLHSWHGSCQGFAHIARVQGTVAFTVSPDLSVAEAKFFWT